MKFCRDHKGSISIFLLAIMASMLIFSFAVLDFSKINLAASTARNNADLVGNAVLTDYDAVLKDAYGLFANSKDIDELSKNVADYYVKTMSSSGIDVKSNNEIYQFIHDLINSPEVLTNNNMLNIRTSPVTAGGASYDSGICVQPVGASAISNPAVMKRQIVEYMKYRGPVSAATGLLEKLNFFKDMGNQAQATNDRLKYEESLNKVQRSSDETYDFVQSYLHNIDNVSSKYYPGGEEIKYGSQGKGTISQTVGSAPVDVIHNKYNDVIKKTERLAPLKECIYNGGLSRKKQITAAKPNSLQNFKNLVSNASSKTSYIYLKNLFNEYQYENELLDTDDYSDETYELLKNAAGIYDGSYNSGLSGLYRDFFKLYYGTELSSDNFSESELNSVTELKDVLEWAFGSPEVVKSYTVVAHESAGALDNTVKSLWNDAQSSLNDYNGYMNAVASTLFYQQNAAGVLGGITQHSPLDDLKEKIADAKDKSETWGKSIENVETESAKASMKNAHDTEAENFENVDVDSIKNEFGRQYYSYLNAYEALTGSYGSIGNTRMYETEQKTDFRGILTCNFKMLYNNVDDLLYKWSSEDSNTYNQNVSELSKNSKPQAASEINNNRTSFSNNINSGTNEKVIKLLRQISEKNIIVDKSQQAEKKKEGEKEKKQLEDSKKSLEQKKKEEIEKINNIPESTNDMSDVTGIETFAQYAQRVDLDSPENGSVPSVKLSFDSESLNPKDNDTSGMQNLLTDFMNLVGQIAEGGRDNLFVTQYLADSFSCITTGKKDGKNIESPTNIAGLILSDKSNKHYKSELEYIIYGCKTEAGNKTAAIASISAIRLVLNLIYSYTDSEITAFTTSTAAAITAVFPFAMPVVKTVLHILLSTAETAYDIVMLTDGYSVPIFKTTTTWMCKGSNIVGNVAQKLAEKTVDYVVSELEKKAVDFVNGKQEDLTEWKNEMLEQKKEELIAEVNTYIIIPLQDFVSDAVAKCKMEDTAKLGKEAGEKVSLIFSQMRAAADDSGESGVMGKIMSKLVSSLNENDIKNKVIDLVEDETLRGLDNFENKFNEKMKSVTDLISNTVDSFSKELDKIIEDAALEAKRLAVNGINTAGDKIMSSINNQISEKLSGKRNVSFGTGNGGITAGKASSVVNMLTMNYKDYLCIFLYIQMIGGSDATLMRAAQLMQCNINHIDGSDSYNMNTAATMFNIYSGSKVKTSVIGRVADSNGVTLKNLSDGYYNIYVSSFAGY